MRYFFYIGAFFIISLCRTAAASPWQQLQSDLAGILEQSYTGTTEIQSDIFGDTYLAVDRTGTRGATLVTAGLHWVPKAGWTIQHPDIRVEAEPWQATVLPQFRTDLPATQNWTETYRRETIFPVILTGQPAQAIELKMSVLWRACPINSDELASCVEVPRTYSLSLSASEAYPTVQGASLRYALRTAAFDIEQTDVRIKNRLLDDGGLKIRFYFPWSVQHIDIQTQNPYRLKPVAVEPAGSIWTFTFQSDSPLQIGDELPLNLRTTHGCYTANLTIGQDDIAPMPDALSLWTAFWTGLFFFVLSPFWCLWLRPQALAKNVSELRQNLKAARWSILGSGLGLLVLWLLNIPPTDWLQITGVAVIEFAVILYLLGRPIVPIWVAGLLMMVLPKPFWGNIALISNTAKIGVILWWMICCWLAFNVWAMASGSVLKFFKRAEKDVAYGFWVRVPYLVIGGWLLLGISVPVWSPSDPISPAELKGPAIVRIVPPFCVRCGWERIIPMAAIDTKRTPIYRLDASSERGRKKLKEYGMSGRYINLFIDKTGRETVMPQGLSLKKIKDVLRPKQD